MGLTHLARVKYDDYVGKDWSEAPGTVMSAARGSAHSFILSSSSSLPVNNFLTHTFCFMPQWPKNNRITSNIFGREQDDEQYLERCDHPDCGGRPVQGGGWAVQVQKADCPFCLCCSRHRSSAFHHKGSYGCRPDHQQTTMNDNYPISSWQRMLPETSPKCETPLKSQMLSL